MTDQQKILRVFKLIQLLSRPPYYNVPQLARYINTSDRSIYRYLETLKAIGYLIDCDERNRYFLILDYRSKQNNPLEVHEWIHLQDLIAQLGAHDPLAQGILAKLHAQGTLIPAADSLNRLYTYQNIQALTTAIQEGLQVRLCDYHSASSNTVSDRVVEPVQFAVDYTYLWAFDPKHAEQRQFKLERIGRVEVLAERISEQRLAEALDIFGFNGPQWLPVHLKLSNYAGQLLLEEFPACKGEVQKVEQHYVYVGQVRDWRGIGRFVLGLPGEVEVLEPEEFRGYLRERVGRKLY